MRGNIFGVYSTDYSVAFAFTRSSTVKSSNVSISHSTVTEHFLQNSIKFSDTTLTNYPQDLKNNFMVHVIISLSEFLFSSLPYVFLHTSTSNVAQREVMELE